MNKIIVWAISHTKAGKIVKSIQVWLDGKKQIIASLATAIPATLLIVKNFTDLGLPYLLSIASTPEFTAASLGWIGLFNAIKGNKAIAAIKTASDLQQATPPVAVDNSVTVNVPK